MTRPEAVNSFNPRDPDWERRCRDSFAAQQYMRLIGGEIVSLAPGQCIVAVRMKPELTQQRGFLHGGVTAALADTAAGFAAYSLMPAGSSPLTVEFKINLMAPAAGERFLASGNVVRSGRTLTIVEVDVSAQAKGETQMIAKMLATLICLENTPDRAGAGQP
jgi:uncharacterized protein (TIGR00369 family)